MRRLVMACAIVLALFAVPSIGMRTAHADTSTSANCVNGGPGTYTCTMHGSQPLDFGPACGFADVQFFGSGVLHLTINKAGDSWITGTLQGPVVGLDTLGNTVMTGHAQAWFGSENNQQSNVQHFTTNVSGKLSDGTNVGAHINGDVTMNANGTITASHMNFDCRA